MDKSVELFPIKNSVEVSDYKNQIDLLLVKVETLTQFVTPAQVTFERKEVG